MTVTTHDPQIGFIIIDLQRGIVVSLPTVHPAAEVVEHASALADAFRRHGLPVVLVSIGGGPSGRAKQAPSRSLALGTARGGDRQRNAEPISYMLGPRSHLRACGSNMALTSSTGAIAAEKMSQEGFHVVAKIGVLMIVLSFGVAGCAQTGASSATRPEKAAEPVAASGTAFPGMNSNGEVIDASKVESGHGQKVHGINDYDGEITGIPAPNSKFTQLQIGMGMRQAIDIAGQPTDQGAYVTGKAFIPFYFGGDRHRFELVYKGQGRLIFAGGSLGNYTGGNLIWIIHCATEPGYR
jgi:hypothetical protein